MEGVVCVGGSFFEIENQEKMASETGCDSQRDDVSETMSPLLLSGWTCEEQEDLKLIARRALCRDIYDRWKNTLHGFELSEGHTGMIVRLFVPPRCAKILSIATELQRRVCREVLAVDDTVCVTLDGYGYVEEIMECALEILRAEEINTMDGICRPAHQVFYASRLATYNGFASKELYIELCTALRPRYWLGHAHNKAGLTFSAETSEKVASLTAEMIRPFTNTRLYATAGLLEEAREMLGPDAVFVDTELRACLYGGVGGFPRKQDEFACRVCLMNVEKKGSLCGLCEERGF